MPRAPRFTERDVKEKAQPGKLLFVSDTPCLYLWTSPGPKRKQRWTYRYTDPDKGRVTTKSLGSYPEVTLEMAKNGAAYARKILKVDKINPFKTDWNEGSTKTYGEVAQAWLDNNKSPGKEKQYKNAKHLVLVLGEQLLKKPIMKIRPTDIHDALKSRWDENETPKQVQRARAKIEQVFDFANAKRWFFDENPASWKKLKHLFPKLKIEREHFDAMPYEDVPGFIQVLRARQSNSAAAVALEFCLLTAARSAEVRGMRWSEVDLENRLWTVPKARMKGGREHSVPLSDRAVEILNRQEERKQCGVDHYVFFAHQRHDKPLDEKGMRGLLRKMGIKDATVHGFRSSFSDWGGDETDYARETIEECLAHRVGNTTTQAYRRRTALVKRRIVMDHWSSYCSGS
jgi:integrase